MGLYVCGDIHPNTYLTDPLDLYQCNLPGGILLHLLRIVVGILLRPWIVISTFRRQCSLLSCTLSRGKASCQCLVQE